MAKLSPEPAMITLGIDLSSMPEGTAACLINWHEDRADVEPPVCACTDDTLDDLISKADAIGIDAPFGWPEDFVSAVADWTATTWSKESRSRFQFRETDREVHKQVKRWPLSVSTDRIALPAMRAMALLRRHGVIDRSGDGKFFEVYPSASLYVWELACRGYKKIDEQCLSVRSDILGKLRGLLPYLKVPPGYDRSPDALDALVASLTARAASQGLTTRPTPDQAVAARREGWIHLPTDWPRP